MSSMNPMAVAAAAGTASRSAAVPALALFPV
jgi:hypothetical protein